MRTDGHDEANSPFRNFVNVPNKLYTVTGFVYPSFSVAAHVD